MTDREAMKLALEALECHVSQTRPIDKTTETIEALRQALARPEIPMSPEHLPQYIATNNIKPTTEGGGGAGGAQPEQEPVAYKYTHKTNPLVFYFTERKGKDVTQNPDVIETALYTAPPKREQNREAWLDSVCALLRQAHDVLSMASLPHKREWVGLTDEEIKGILDCGRGGLVDIKKAEQILKEKNGDARSKSQSEG